MVTLTPLYGEETTLTVTGLGTLANNGQAVSNTISLASHFDILIAVTIGTGSAALATGIVTVTGEGSLNGVIWDVAPNAKWIGTISLAAAGSQVTRRVMTVAPSFGGSLPPYIRLSLTNATGAALVAGTVTYRGASVTVA